MKEYGTIENLKILKMHYFTSAIKPVSYYRERYTEYNSEKRHSDNADDIENKKMILCKMVSCYPYTFLEEEMYTIATDFELINMLSCLKNNLAYSIKSALYKNGEYSKAWKFYTFRQLKWLGFHLECEYNHLVTDILQKLYYMSLEDFKDFLRYILKDAII